MEVRVGLPGTWDRIAGSRAGTAENAGSSGLGLAGAVLARRRIPGRRGLDPALRLLAADLCGGVWCTNTSAAVRWYHRDGRGAAQHLAFWAGQCTPSSWPGWTAACSRTGCAGLLLRRAAGRPRRGAALLPADPLSRQAGAAPAR